MSLLLKITVLLKSHIYLLDSIGLNSDTNNREIYPSVNKPNTHPLTQRKKRLERVFSSKS